MGTVQSERSEADPNVIDTLLVPLDGSDSSEAALDPSDWWANRLGVPLQVIRAEPWVEHEEVDDYLRARARALTTAEVTTRTLRHQQAPDAILLAAQELPRPALFMATSGQSGWSLLIGSTTDAVIRRISAPVFLIGPSHVTDNERDDVVVIALDGSRECSVLLPAVAVLAETGHLRVHIVTVAETGTPGDARALAAEAIVRAGAKALDGLGVSSTSHVLYGARAGEQIVSFAAGLSARLIAAGTHGSSGVCATALGSVATHLVERSSSPVLVRRLSS